MLGLCVCVRHLMFVVWVLMLGWWGLVFIMGVFILPCCALGLRFVPDYYWLTEFVDFIGGFCIIILDCYCCECVVLSWFGCLVCCAGLFIV